MGEVVEGVLSETLLDELASDLGIDPKDMRKHPFFRVIKGRVLLTYPLRISTPSYEVINIQLAPGAFQVLEKGEYMVHPCTDAYGTSNWASLDVNMQMYLGGAWRTYPVDDGSKIEMPIYSDGENVRVINDDGSNTHRLVGLRVY